MLHNFRQRRNEIIHQLSPQELGIYPSTSDQLGRMIQGDIFVDISGIDETDFDQSILSNLRNSDVVLLIVSEHTFAPDRIQYDDDWVRREIALALELDKPIVLVYVEGLYSPPPAELPENIRAITRKQGINFYPEYWDAAVQRLTDFVAKVALQISPQDSINQASLDKARQAFLSVLVMRAHQLEISRSKPTK
jgi:hypothetical protein